MLVEEIFEVIKEQKEEVKKRLKRIDKTVPREVDYNKLIKTKNIVAIIGARQVGKSTLLLQLYSKIKKGAFITFEDERLDLKKSDLNKLLEAIYMLYGEIDIFYFDEIQRINGWELFVRRLYDSGKKIFLTGSNSRNLTIPLANSLTGRHINILLLPFSFKEYLKYYNIHIPNIPTTRERAVIKSKFRNYLFSGSYPPYLEENNYLIVNMIYEDILIKDVLLSTGSKELSNVKAVSRYLANNVGDKITFNSATKSLPIESPTTVIAYIDAFVNSFLYFLVYRFDESAKRINKSEKKVYIVDNGIRNIIVLKRKPNYGKLLENLVFLELLRRQNDIYYFKSKNDKECDFVVKDISRSMIQNIQVTYELNDQNKDREVKGLLEAMKYFKLKEGLLLTYDQEDEIEIKDKDGKVRKIIVRPVWKWLLG